MSSMNDEIWSREIMTGAFPDLWWRNYDGSRYEWRHTIEGWKWKMIDTQGNVLAEGYGSP